MGARSAGAVPISTPPWAWAGSELTPRPVDDDELALRGYTAFTERRLHYPMNGWPEGATATHIASSQSVVTIVTLSCHEGVHEYECPNPNHTQ